MAGGLDAGAWLGLGIRVVVHTVAIVMTTRLLRGSGFARLGLTLLLSVVGLASLVVPAVLAIADAGDVGHVEHETSVVVHEGEEACEHLLGAGEEELPAVSRRSPARTRRRRRP